MTRAVSGKRERESHVRPVIARRESPSARISRASERRVYIYRDKNAGLPLRKLRGALTATPTIPSILVSTSLSRSTCIRVCVCV